MKEYLKEYFSLTKSDRNALIILVIILISVVSFNFLLQYISSSSETNFTNFINEVDEIEERIAIAESEKKSYYNTKSRYDPVIEEVEQNQSQLFYFDPNTISNEKWISLGVKPKIANIIRNYLNKGGHFYKKEDLKKIYGFDKDLYLKLKPYIQIRQDNYERQDKNLQVEYSDKESSQTIETNIQLIELNSATEEELIKIKGIGKTYATRIIKYRDLLGGYYRKEQLLEVYGFNNELFEQIKDMVYIDNSKIMKISLNLSDIKTLAKHPYIDYSLAKEIFNFRTNMGSYKNLDELTQIKEFEDSVVYDNISCYLKLW